MASPLLNVSQLVPLRSAHFSFIHPHFVKQVIVWKVDCSSPSNISLVQLSLPAGKSVVDTGFYTSEFLSLLVQGDGEEGQTLIHLPLVSLAPIMMPSTTTNIPIHQVDDYYDLTKSSCSKYFFVEVEEVTGGRSRLLEGLSARNLATSGPRKVSIQHTFLIF